jgi:hypothetical protein
MGRGHVCTGDPGAHRDGRVERFSMKIGAQ